MDLKEKIVSSYVAFEDGLNINSDVHEIRSKAFQNFEKVGFPTKKMEAWKYTSLESLKKTNYNLLPKASEVLD